MFNLWALAWKVLALGVLIVLWIAFYDDMAGFRINLLARDEKRGYMAGLQLPFLFAVTVIAIFWWFVVPFW